MKKLLIVLASLLMLACAAAAEESKTLDITFRDGIKFGMTEQEVVDADTLTLSKVTYGENQNPHVTFLKTDAMDFNGYSGVTEYLFWDGEMYSVMYILDGNEAFGALYTNLEASNGDPDVSDAEGTATWIESVTGNHPEMLGDQFVWSWDNNITLTLAQFDGGCLVVYIDAN